MNQKIAALCFAKSSIAQHGHAGKNSLDYYAATVYGTVYMGDGYLEVGLAGAFNDIENKQLGLSHYISNHVLGKLGAYF
jgi:hypothetical protein